MNWWLNEWNRQSFFSIHLLRNRRIWTELPHTAHPKNSQYLCCFIKGFQNTFPFSFSPICASHLLSICSFFERKVQDYNKRFENSQTEVNSDLPMEPKYLSVALNNLSLSISQKSTSVVHNLTITYLFAL